MAALLLLSVVSCEKSDTPDKTTDPDLELKSRQVVESNNSFAFDFFKEIVTDENENENYMVSPVSLSLALGMAYNGAEGDTKVAFEDLLNYEGLSRQEINEVNQSLIDNLVTSQDGSLFEVANSVWYRDGFPIKQDFITLNKDYYSAEVRSLNFNSPTAVNTINQWVSDKTHEKIPTILDNIPSNAMLYLINALYFNSKWKYEFDPEDNVQESFTIETSGNTKDVEMMSLETELEYFKNDTFSTIILPYINDKYKMVLFRPENNATTKDVVQSLSSDKWNQLKTMYKTEEKVVVTMPRFKFEYKKTLNEEMINMGLGIAFSENADFSGISDIALAISMILQKTYIDVNEEGTEAAAVTIIGFETTSIPSKPQKIYFTLDKSFVFFITEKETDAICFIGRVGDPVYE